MHRVPSGVVFAFLAMVVMACAPAAPPSPTAAPAKQEAKPPATTAPAKSEAKAEAKVQATIAPAKPVEAKPAASPAAKVADTKPAASPVAKTEAKPVASPAAKAALDQKAVADFYRGKTIRIIVGSNPGGGYDLYARIIARHLPRHIPGNPNVIVEHKPPNNLAANAVFKTEPKDGTAIGSFTEGLVLQQVLGQEGIEFDAARFNWLGAANKEVTGCVVRTDAGIKTIQDVLDGKEAIIGTNAPGSIIHDTPALLKAVLGANVRLVPGYRGGFNDLVLATERKEVDGFCASVDVLGANIPHLLEGTTPAVQALVVTGNRTPDRPFLKGVPAAETLAKTDEARRLLRVADAPSQMGKPYSMAPEVPKDRVEALRTALAATFADPDVKDEFTKARQESTFTSGEEVTRIVQEVMSAPPDVINKLKAIFR